MRHRGLRYLAVQQLLPFALLLLILLCASPVAARSKTSSRTLKTLSATSERTPTPSPSANRSTSRSNTTDQTETVQPPTQTHQLSNSLALTPSPLFISRTVSLRSVSPTPSSSLSSSHTPSLVADRTASGSVSGSGPTITVSATASATVSRSSSARFVAGGLSLLSPKVTALSTDTAALIEGSGLDVAPPVLRTTIDGALLRVRDPPTFRTIVLGLAGFRVAPWVFGGDARQCLNATVPSWPSYPDARYDLVTEMQVAVQEAPRGRPYVQTVTITLPVLDDANADDSTKFAWGPSGSDVILTLKFNHTCFFPSVNRVDPFDGVIIAVSPPMLPTLVPAFVTGGIAFAAFVVALCSSLVHGYTPLVLHDVFSAASSLRATECNLRGRDDTVNAAMNAVDTPYYLTLIPQLTDTFGSQVRPVGAVFASSLVWIVLLVAGLVCVRVQMCRPGWFVGNSTSTFRFPAVLAPFAFAAMPGITASFVVACMHFDAGPIAACAIFFLLSFTLCFGLVVAPTAAVGGPTNAARWYDHRVDVVRTFGPGSTRLRLERLRERAERIVVKQKAKRAKRITFSDLDRLHHGTATPTVVMGSLSSSSSSSDGDDDGEEAKRRKSFTLRDLKPHQRDEAEEEPREPQEEVPLLPPLDPISRFFVGEGYWQDEIFDFDTAMLESATRAQQVNSKSPLPAPSIIDAQLGAIPRGASAWRCGHYRRHYTVFTGYRHRFAWFAIVDALWTWVVVGLVYGWRPRVGECDSLGPAVAIANGLRLLIVVAARPYRTPFATTGAVAVATLVVVGNAFGAVYNTASNPPAYWAAKIATVAYIAALVLGLMRNFALLLIAAGEYKQQRVVRALVAASNKRYYDAWWTVDDRLREEAKANAESEAKERLRRYELRRQKKESLEEAKKPHQSASSLDWHRPPAPSSVEMSTNVPLLTMDAVQQRHPITPPRGSAKRSAHARVSFADTPTPTHDATEPLTRAANPLLEHWRALRDEDSALGKYGLLQQPQQQTRPPEATLHPGDPNERDAHNSRRTSPPPLMPTASGVVAETSYAAFDAEFDSVMAQTQAEFL